MITFAASALVLLFLPSVTVCQDDNSEVKVDSSIVLLNVVIKDQNDFYVRGLKRPLFHVFEDGVEQEIEYFSDDQTPFAAVLLIDTSGSMEERVSLARSAAIRFLDGLRENDVASIYCFDSRVRQVQGFSSSHDIDEAAFELKAEGMTRLNDAIFEAGVLLENRPEKRRAIVVLSDGQDTLSSHSSELALKAALNANAVIYTIDMSPIGDTRRRQNQAPLRNFAVKSGGTFIETPGGSALRSSFEKIVQELGNQYTIGYSPSNTVKNGKWRSIELKVMKPQLSLRTRTGYKAEK